MTLLEPFSLVGNVSDFQNLPLRHKFLLIESQGAEHNDFPGMSFYATSSTYMERSTYRQQVKPHLSAENHHEDLHHPHSSILCYGVRDSSPRSTSSSTCSSPLGSPIHSHVRDRLRPFGRRASTLVRYTSELCDLHQRHHHRLQVRRGLQNH